MRARRLAVLALVLAGLSGCGGSYGGGDEGGGGMSAADYRAAAGKICRDGKAATAKLSETTQTDAAYAKQLRKLLVITADTRKRFGELDPPDDLQKAHDDLLAANDEGVSVTKGIADRLEAGEKRAAVLDEETGQKILGIARERDAAAKALGVKDCGSDLPASQG